MRFRVFLLETGLVVATTVGAGMFALPYVFEAGNTSLGLLYLIILCFVISRIHASYWRVLQSQGGTGNLLALAREKLGRFGYWISLVSVVGGLLLTLVVYLILGTQFLKAIVPSANDSMLLLIFWLISSLPFFLSSKRFLALELVGTFVLVGIILFVFFASEPASRAANTPESPDFFLPFAPLLFALAGWTAVEPALRFSKESVGGFKAGKPLDRELGAERLAAGGFQKPSAGASARPPASLALGTGISALLYLLFVGGIVSSAANITPDTISGLTNWSQNRLALLSILGLFAIWTSYIPIGLEIKNSLHAGMGWRKSASAACVILAPPMLVLAGLSNFLTAIGLAGGVFLSLQYLTIAGVSNAVLRPRFWGKLFLVGAGAAFLLAAFYETYLFVIQ